MTNKIKIQKRGKEYFLTCARSILSQPYSLFFDSNRSTHPASQWSFLCYDPIETIETKNGIIAHNDNIIGAHDFFEFLQSRLNNYNFEFASTDIPFIGGAAGYFGYDLGFQIEPMTRQTVDDLKAPDAAIGIYTNILAFNHSNNETWLIGDEPNLSKTIKPAHNKTLHWQPQINEQDYLNDIQKVIDYIYAGEIYQANLSRRFDAESPSNFSPQEHYFKLREINSAPYSAFMNFKDMQLSCCSPEQFLSINNNIVTTRPIKGTLSSSQSPNILLSSEKDIAENIMIVDLLRNDLSKVCDFHSVQTPQICALETFEGLHHLVSTITGTLQDNIKPLDVLRACFPGGSITGAPKIRAMQIIEELETTQRGPYCGAMGYIGFNGNMDSNIIIRTLIYKNNRAYLQTGSGIVSDSNVKNELQETLDKAQKIFESFDDELKDKKQ